MIERCASHIGTYVGTTDDDFISENERGYGLLYNAYALGLLMYGQYINNVSAYKLGPVNSQGWRIPTASDYNNIYYEARWWNRGRKLKSVRASNSIIDDEDGIWKPLQLVEPSDIAHPSWYDQSIGSDEFGFNAIPAGRIDANYNRQPIGGYFGIWRNDIYSANQLIALVLTRNSDSIRNDLVYLSNGISVRFCRDKGNNPSSGIVFDSDGNEYTYVTIGDLQWITSNWKSTKYINGDPIINGNSKIDWQYAASTGVKRTRTLVVNGVNSNVYAYGAGAYSFPLFVSGQEMFNFFRG